MTSPANSGEDNLLSEIRYLESQVQSFRPKRTGITFMCPMLVHGVRFCGDSAQIIHPVC